MKSTNFPVFNVLLLLVIGYLVYDNIKLREEVHLNQRLLEECVNDVNFRNNYKKFQTEFMNETVKRIKKGIEEK